MTAWPGARSAAQADGFYLWRPPEHATASVTAQSRWGNLYAAPARVRSLAVDVHRQAQVIADVEAPSRGTVADRLPGRSLRLRVPDLPAPPFHGRYRALLSLGEVTDLVVAYVAVTPCLGSPGSGMQVRIAAAAPGAVFGLSHPQAGRPPNRVNRAARMVRLLVDATAGQAIRLADPLANVDGDVGDDVRPDLLDEQRAESSRACRSPVRAALLFSRLEMMRSALFPPTPRPRDAPFDQPRGISSGSLSGPLTR
jgi:hypothetical protein